MISRLLVIALAFGAAVVKAMQGAWVEAVGLAGLGAGLAALRFVENRSIARPIAAASWPSTSASTCQP